jgi:hypothetical protein
MNAWEKLAENRIQEALASGALAAPSNGTPLDLSDYFALPASERAGAFLLGQAGVMPPEVELLKQAAALEHELASAEPERARELRAQLQQARVTYGLAMERRARAAQER